jgi:hypothetical protein
MGKIQKKKKKKKIPGQEKEQENRKDFNEPEKDG